MLNLHLAGQEGMPEARSMFREYESELGIDLCFQGFEEELASLPGRYGPPSGALLIAEFDGQLAGCGALRDLGDGYSELKRMYVRPRFRGHGIGRAICLELLSLAGSLEYRAARLDTLRRLEVAISLYESLGFRRIAPYNLSPGLEVVHMEKPL